MQDPGRPPELVPVTSADDRREHLVDEFTFTTSSSGCWTARCGTQVVSAPLGALPMKRCELCDPHTDGAPPAGMRGLLARLATVVGRPARSVRRALR